MEQTPGGLITNWNGFISLGKIDREREKETAFITQLSPF